MGNEADFVFIIGAGRSGTKYVRNVLDASADMVAIPFDIGYVWKYGNEDLVHDCIPAGATQIEIKVYIQNQLEKMARKIGGSLEGRSIVEKTVANALRVPFVYELFPEAKFIHLIRDGRDVAESASRIWNEPVGYRYTLQKLRFVPLRNIGYLYKTFVENTLRGIKDKPRIWGPRYPRISEDINKLSILEVACKQWVECISRSADAFKGIPSSNVFELRYEELVENDTVVRDLADFLNVEDVESMLSYYSSSISRTSSGKWQQLDAQDQKKMMEILQPTLSSLGYLDS